MLIRAVPEHTVFEIVALLALVGLLVLSFEQSDSVDPFWLNVGHSVDIGHVIVYALLASATMLSVPRRSLTLWRAVGIVIAISLLGIEIELLQPLVERTTSAVDLAGNEFGIGCGIAIVVGYCCVERVRARESEKRPVRG